MARTATRTFTLSALTAGVMLAGNALASDINVDANCTLADAIEAINKGRTIGDCTNGDGNADTIVLPSGDIRVDRTLIINADMTIRGAGRGTTRISPEPGGIGDPVFRPLFVRSGTVVIEDLDLRDGTAQGGRGGPIAGGGAGLGGALFIEKGNVTLRNAGFYGNRAQGGLAGASSNTANFAHYGGGGGMGGDGKTGSYDQGGNGGGFSSNNTSADGSRFEGGAGGTGSYDISTGRFVANDDAGNGGFGGGGGGGTQDGSGGNGGFGGGGGGSGWAYYQRTNGGDGGFGGGAGAGSQKGHLGSAKGGENGKPGAFGGSAANNPTGRNGSSGGGGAGLGGAIFIKKGTLTLQDVSFENNRVVAGQPPNDTSGSAGEAHGGALFVCTSDMDSSCGAEVSIDSCNVSFTNNNIAEIDNITLTPVDIERSDVFGVPKRSLSACGVDPNPPKEPKEEEGKKSSSGAAGWWALLALPVLLRRRLKSLR